MSKGIEDYHQKAGKLMSEGERLRLLQIFDEVVPRIPDRPLAEVKSELRAVRRARRAGGRRSAGRRR